MTNCPPEEPQTSKQNKGNRGDGMDALIEPTAEQRSLQDIKRDNGNRRTRRENRRGFQPVSQSERGGQGESEVP